MSEAKPMPWQHERYVNYESVFEGHIDIPKHAYNIMFGVKRHCLTVYETLSDYSRSYWKVGDLVKFNHGFMAFDVNEEWQSWFMNEDDLQRHLEENCKPHEKVPSYARNQYAIILGRYKYTKYKIRTFRDYGSVLMMLTGDAIGHIRRFYNCAPWDRVDMYPYYNKIKQLDCNSLFHGVKLQRDVTKFLEELMRKIADDYS